MFDDDDTIVFAFSSGITPRQVMYRNSDHSVRYMFSDTGELEGIMFTNKTIVYNMSYITKDERWTYSLYSNIDPVEIHVKTRLLFKRPEKVTREDILMLKLQHDMDVSILDFDEIGNISDKCKRDIDIHVLEIALQKIEENESKDMPTGARLYRYVWTRNSQNHINTARGLINN